LLIKSFKIQIRKHEDKKILSGVIVTIGDKRIDGRAFTRLAKYFGG
jgi:F0F1-type ATP synthase delta subunit